MCAEDVRSKPRRVAHRPRWGKGEKKGEIESAKERPGHNRDLSSARQTRGERARARRVVGEVREPTGTREASYVRAGGKEEPEEWIEDVRRPVHHLCRPTGIAAGVPCSVAGWRKREGRKKERKKEREREIESYTFAYESILSRRRYALSIPSVVVSLRLILARLVGTNF